MQSDNTDKRAVSSRPSSLQQLVHRLPLRHTAAGLILLSGLIALTPGIDFNLQFFSQILLAASLIALGIAGFSRDGRVGLICGGSLTITIGAVMGGCLFSQPYCYLSAFAIPIL